MRNVKNETSADATLRVGKASVGWKEEASISFLMSLRHRLRMWIEDIDSEVERLKMERLKAGLGYKKQVPEHEPEPMPCMFPGGPVPARFAQSAKAKGEYVIVYRTSPTHVEYLRESDGSVWVGDRERVVEKLVMLHDPSGKVRYHAKEIK